MKLPILNYVLHMKMAISYGSIKCADFNYGSRDLSVIKVHKYKFRSQSFQIFAIIWKLPDLLTFVAYP